MKEKLELKLINTKACLIFNKGEDAGACKIMIYSCNGVDGKIEITEYLNYEGKTLKKFISDSNYSKSARESSKEIENLFGIDHKDISYGGMDESNLVIDFLQRRNKRR